MASKVSEVSQMTDFAIVSGDKVYFKTNYKEGGYKFPHDGLAHQLRIGVGLAPYERSKFEKRKIMKSPDVDKTVSIELFFKFMRYYGETSLKSDGFKVVEFIPKNSPHPS